MLHHMSNVVNLHDSVKGVKQSRIYRDSDDKLVVNVTFVLNDDFEYDEAMPVRLHSTNGINHDYTIIGEHDVRLTEPEPAEETVPKETAILTTKTGMGGEDTEQNEPDQHFDAQTYEMEPASHPDAPKEKKPTEKAEPYHFDSLKSVDYHNEPYMVQSETPIEPVEKQSKGHEGKGHEGKGKK